MRDFLVYQESKVNKELYRIQGTCAPLRALMKEAF